MAAPALARRHVQAAGRAWTVDLRDVAVLLTSELVANAVVHGSAPVTLLVRDEDGQVRVEVTDADPATPTRPGTAPDQTGESGRGLQFVDALAAVWGVCVHDDGTGKTTWFELAHPPA